MSDDGLRAWIDEITERLPVFVRHLAFPALPGRYRYTLSEQPSEFPIWGLGQTSFAVRILYQSGALTATERRECAAFIHRFETSEGAIHDPHIARLSRWRRMLSGVRHLDLDILTNRTNIRAETRQATAALFNLDASPSHPVAFIPVSVEAASRYIARLNWQTPWAAASHVNHLLFFIKFHPNLKEGQKQPLIDHVMQRLRTLQREDGGFGGGQGPMAPHQRVGSAMKVLMGAALVNREAELVSTSLIDAALDDPACRDACEHFNTLFVLYQCSKHLDHRRDQVAAMAQCVAEQWRDFYWPEHGAFSFNKGRSAVEYYGARIGTGLPEPDIHGSAMFYWGLLLVARMLNLPLLRPMHEPIL